MTLLRWFPGEDRHREAVAQAKAAGRMGATRVPDTVLFRDGRDPSDSMIVRCVSALEEGRSEREQPREYDPNAYLRWLSEHVDRLSRECLESGCEDGGAWLRQQYTIETGKQP